MKKLLILILILILFSSNAFSTNKYESQSYDARSVVLYGHDTVSHITPIQVDSTGQVVTNGNGKITAYNTYSQAGDSRLAYGLTTNDSYRSMYPIMWANDKLLAYGPGFESVGNHSAGGETLAISVSSGRWASFIADGNKNGGIAYNGLMFFGYNDLNPANDPNNLTLSQFLTNFATKLDEALTAYNDVWIMGATPLTASLRASYLNTWYIFPALDAGFRTLVATRPHAHFIDLYSDSVDTASSQLDAKNGLIQQDAADGVHQTTSGAQNYGYALEKQYGKMLNLVSTLTAGTNVLPTFSGTGGTQVGTFICTTESELPTGWTIELISGTGTNTSVTVTTIAGGWKRLVFDNTLQANDVTLYVRQNSTYRTSMASSFANGDTIQGRFQYQLHDILGVVNLGGFVRINNNNAMLAFMGGKATQEDTVVPPTIGYGGIRRTTRYTLTATPTSAEMVIEIYLKASSGVATLDISDPQMYKLQ